MHASVILQELGFTLLPGSLDAIGRVVVLTFSVYGSRHFVSRSIPVPRRPKEAYIPWVPPPRATRVHEIRRIVMRGCIVGALVAFGASHHWLIFLLAALTLPYAGGWAAWHMSTEARIAREEKLEDEEKRQEAEAEQEAKAARERKSAEEHQLRRLAVDRWRRVSEALLWWSTTGRALHADARFLADYAAAHEEVIYRYESIHAAYTNPDEICSTEQRRREVAEWAVKNHAEEIAFLTPHEADRTVQGLARILSLHLRRDMFVYREAKGLADAKLIQAVRGESWEDGYRRVRERTQSFTAGRDQAFLQIEAEAQGLRPEAREEYIARQKQLVDELIERDMRRLAGLE